MSNKIKYRLARIIYRRRLKKRLRGYCTDETEGRVILLNVPSHGNLGDHLISVAEKQLVKDLKGFEPLTFTTADLYYGIDIVEDFINPKDIILISGGGYLGSIWPDEEARISKLVKDLRENTIIVMPQTVYYDNSDVAQRMIEESSQVYKNHPNFYLSVREKNSLEVVSKDLRLEQSYVALLPDMALYLSYSDNTKARSGIILCMRDDKEKADNQDLVMAIHESVKGRDVRCLDTQVNRSINQNEEKQEVLHLIEQFRSAQLVITDRLHGMLYATISGTPVIALDNCSHKVRNVYDCWLKGLKHVRFVDSSAALVDSITELVNSTPGVYNPEPYQKQLQSFLRDKL